MAGEGFAFEDGLSGGGCELQVLGAELEQEVEAIRRGSLNTVYKDRTPQVMIGRKNGECKFPQAHHSFVSAAFKMRPKGFL
ncbi:MAG: hypothetical protein A3F68_11085 [Acidobacteria bacterium RIFCSPLOWO2_12_FULL_54_10]|nr:MAG: hypothetical protein A3F68_11085 [Acidobacteria bacterium RIFCSPLOWO2_12_FULL_54_10]